MQTKAQEMWQHSHLSIFQKQFVSGVEFAGKLPLIHTIDVESINC